jgi:hypothetical protein
MKAAEATPETGFDRVVALTPEEVVDVLRVLDRPEQPNRAFRVDSEGFIRRRVRGGPTVGKVAAVQAVVFAMMRAGLLVLRQEGGMVGVENSSRPVDRRIKETANGAAPAIQSVETRLGQPLVPTTGAPPPRSSVDSIAVRSGTAPVLNEVDCLKGAQPRATLARCVGSDPNFGPAPLAQTGSAGAPGDPLIQKKEASIKTTLWKRQVSESTMVAGFLVLLLIWVPTAISLWTR